MRIRRGDTVVVLSGQHKGASGKVRETLPKRGRVIVEGVNIRTKHEKPSQKNQNRGGVLKTEMSIDASNVALARPGDSKKTTRIGYRVSDKGVKTRVARQAKNKEIK